MSVLAQLLALRNDPRAQRVPPFLSALCVIVGVVWLLILPLNEYARHTYISENALLPGQVHTYFGGSEHNIFRAYRQEVAALGDKTDDERTEKLVELFKTCGLRVAHQNYQYTAAGKNVTGQNVYAVLQGPRADATEAVVFIGAWRNMDKVLNQSGVALVLTMARYFKRWSLWSKDIIFLITGDSTAGPQAWVDAYHDAHAPSTVDSLTLKSGALQGAVAVDYPAGPWGHRFDKLHVIYDGINGQLPNLDLFNTAVSIASGQMGISCTLQRMWKHDDSYKERLETMLRGMLSQGFGHASGPHSSFIPYHVDAITLQTVGDGWHDEMSLGRTIESIFRSLNNLLEHLHQSFFFYLLMQANRFVSIGTYLPSAMLVAVNFTITSIALWVQSGRPKRLAKIASTEAKKDGEKENITIVKEGEMVAIVPAETFQVTERQLFLPTTFVCGLHFLGLVPLYIFNNTSESSLTNVFTLSTIAALLLPPFASLLFVIVRTPTRQDLTLFSCFSLLLLGMFLSALATLNFSLAFLVGLLTTPLSFVHLCIPSGNSGDSSNPQSSGLIRRALCTATALLLAALSPLTLTFITTWVTKTSTAEILTAASLGWHIHGLWTQVVVWLVWWPAWFAGSVVAWMGAIGSLREP
ncbi:MAG: Glycosyl phosphatidyl inositol protein transamidase complex subunit [Bathelium mastoideum]|nr:MAG: Glycosyl phosphatidyl inositol protein transamidase complex subunit [Bathelium mastoideum]KAI9684021.1 MAG: Glycosyl phosphatidyl inositol protein transamidase complex subunit [Bathelium mastoideum]